MSGNRIKFMRAVAAGLCRIIMGVRVAETGGDIRHDRPSVYFANHGSHLDAVAIWASLAPEQRERVRPVAARDYWEKNALRRFLARDIFNVILIDRPGEKKRPGERTKVIHRSVARSFQDVIDTMEANGSVIIFPEGTRGDGKTMAPFKSGLYHLAKRKPEADLVPVYIENLNRMLPKGELLPLPLMGSVTFAPPIRLEENESKRAFLERARNAIVAMERK